MPATGRTTPVVSWVFAKLFHQIDIFTVERGVISTASSSTAAAMTSTATLSTIARYVPSTTADSANQSQRHVGLFRAIVFAMSHITAVLASLSFVVTKRSIEGRELTKLRAFQFVLTFRDGGSRVDDPPDSLQGFGYFLLVVCRDKTVEIFVLSGMRSGIGPFTFLD